MNSQKELALIKLIITLIVILGFGSWIGNAVRLSSCDFKADYKCEVIHGVGLIAPPISMVTVWFADDGN